MAEITAWVWICGSSAGWFFLPPAGHSDDLIEPVHTGDPQTLNLPASDLTTLVVGSPAGWQDLLDRMAELLNTDHEPTWDALLWALRGERDDEHWEQQINLRRRAIEEVTLARLAGPTDDVITNMAGLLVQLVKLTPFGYNKLRETDPEQALALLAEGDQLVDNLTTEAERRRKSGEPSRGGLDDLKPIDPERALGLTADES